jgi:hypothetical protein
VDSKQHLDGKVVAFTPWADSSHPMEVAIAFTAVCQNKDTATLILIALHYITDDDQSQSDMVSSLPQGLGVGAYGRASSGASPLASLPSEDAGKAIYPLAKIGEVKGLHHISLAVAKGPKGATLISTPDKKYRLDEGTRLALVPVPQKN